MMDPEDLHTDLQSLRKLYGLLENDGQSVQDAGSENLDNNTRLLLRNLLDGAAKKVFEDHAKMLGTQNKTSYSLWSMQPEQSRDGPTLQPFSLRNAPTDFSSGVQSTAKDSTLPKIDLITSEGIFPEPRNQVVFSGQSQSTSAGESGVRLKRCRVCQRPKIKQLTKENSIRDSEVFTSNKLSSDNTILSINGGQKQNHKRHWEDESGYGDLACSSSSPVTFDFVKSLASCSLTDEKDKISREASARIQQIESRIMAFRLAAKRVDLLESDSESKLGQTGNFAVGRSDPKSITSRGTWTPRDTAHQWYDQTARSIGELNLQGRLVGMRTANTMLPSSQTMFQAAEEASPSEVEEPVVNRSEMFNQIKYRHDYMPEETYNLLHGAGISTDLNKMVDKNRPLHGKFSSQINSQLSDQMQMGRREPMRTLEMNQWLIPSVGSRPWDRYDYGIQEAEITRQKKPGKMYKNQMDNYSIIQGKHELVDPKRLVSHARQWLSDSSAPSSNYSSSRATESQSLPAYTSHSESEGSSLASPAYSSEKELYSGSSRSTGKEETESELYSVSSRDPSPHASSSYESSGSMSRRAVPTKEFRRGSYESSGSVSRRTVSTKEYRRGSYESSGSVSRRTVPTKEYRRGSYEYLGSISRRTVPTKEYRKGKEKEPQRKQTGRLRRLKDKLAVIFHNHQHHHHYHHHHHQSDEDNHRKSSPHNHGDEDKHRKSSPRRHGDEDNRRKSSPRRHGDEDNHRKSSPRNRGDKDNHKKSLSIHVGKALDHQRRAEVYGEQVVNKNGKQLVVHKLANKNQKGHFQALMGGFLKHAQPSSLLKNAQHSSLLKHAQRSNKSKKSKGGKPKIPSRPTGQHGGGKMSKKMRWWQMLRQQRRMKRLEKLRGKLDLGRNR